MLKVGGAEGCYTCHDRKAFQRKVVHAAAEGRLRLLPPGPRLRPEEPPRRRRGEALLEVPRPVEGCLPEGPRRTTRWRARPPAPSATTPTRPSSPSCSRARSTPSCPAATPATRAPTSAKPFALQETGAQALRRLPRPGRRSPPGARWSTRPSSGATASPATTRTTRTRKKLTRAEGNALCIGCHKPMGEKVSQSPQAGHHGRRLRLLPQAARLQAEGAARDRRRRQLRRLPRQGEGAGQEEGRPQARSRRAPASPATTRTAPTSRAWARGARTRPATPATRAPRRSS